MTEIGATALGVAFLLNPGAVIGVGVTYLIGKAVAAEYKSEVAACDRLLKKNFDGNPGNAALVAAESTASIMDALSVPTAGLSSLALHLEARKMRKLREKAMVTPMVTPGVVCEEHRQSGVILGNLAMGY